MDRKLGVMPLIHYSSTFSALQCPGLQFWICGGGWRLRLVCEKSPWLLALWWMFIKKVLEKLSYTLSQAVISYNWWQVEKPINRPTVWDEASHTDDKEKIGPVLGPGVRFLLKPSLSLLLISWVQWVHLHSVLHQQLWYSCWVLKEKGKSYFLVIYY